MFDVLFVDIVLWVDLPIENVNPITRGIVMSTQGKVDYIELPSRDLKATKSFFSDTFGWSFQDYGDTYAAFSGAGMDGGFFASDQTAAVETGTALVILYSPDLEQSLQKVKEAGGTISKEIFSFPGGRRFHFKEPGGSELAIWSDKGLEE